MNDSIGRAVDRYAALFRLPAHKTILASLFGVCFLNGLFVIAVFQLSTVHWLGLGLALGLVLFAFAALGDYVIHFASIDRDPVLTMRRCSALSFYSLLLWLPFLIAGYFLNFPVSGVWFRFFVLGFCATLALRILVLAAVSFASIVEVTVYSLLLPTLFVFSVVYTGSTFGALTLDLSSLGFFFLCVAATSIAAFLYFYSINRVGKEVVGVGSFSVLRAFLATWTEDLNDPFEQLFERFSQERDIQLSAFSFRSSKGIVKAMIVVPAFHPGPFKNLGSSALPYMIEKALEEKLEHCLVMVPHGLSGHDLDLATQGQNRKVLEKALELSRMSTFGKDATVFQRAKKSGASASCQAFNNCALVTLTLAPETMEDLPPELNSLIRDSAGKLGFSSAIIVDAHNSIQGPFKINQALKPLKEVAVASLEKTCKLEPSSFQAGVGRAIPKEFSVEQGMGPGGISALLVRVNDQTTAYITIDGNNMVSGLRERILSSLSELGVDKGEVFTTDTHAVNAVVLEDRGYHPVGEAMDQGILIDYVKQATTDALANLEPSEVAWRSETVTGVKVIGEKQIEALCVLVDRAMKRAKKLAVSIFPVLGVALAALLLLF